MGNILMRALFHHSHFLSRIVHLVGIVVVYSFVVVVDRYG